MGLDDKRQRCVMMHLEISLAAKLHITVVLTKILCILQDALRIEKNLCVIRQDDILLLACSYRYHIIDDVRTSVFLYGHHRRSRVGRNGLFCLRHLTTSTLRLIPGHQDNQQSDSRCSSYHILEQLMPLNMRAFLLFQGNTLGIFHLGKEMCLLKLTPSRIHIWHRTKLSVSSLV